MFLLLAIAIAAISADENSTNATTTTAFSGYELDDPNMYCPLSAVFFGFIGAMLALVFSNMGAAYGTWKSGIGLAKLSLMTMKDNTQVARAMLPVIMAGVSGIYGLIIAVIIANNIKQEGRHSIFNGYAQFNAGLVCGLSNLASGLAVGLAGEPGVVSSAREPKLYVGMVLVWSFASALGLYGLIVGLIMASVDGNSLCRPGLAI